MRGRVRTEIFPEIPLRLGFDRDGFRLHRVEVAVVLQAQKELGVGVGVVGVGGARCRGVSRRGRAGCVASGAPGRAGEADRAQAHTIRAVADREGIIGRRRMLHDVEDAGVPRDASKLRCRIVGEPGQYGGHFLHERRLAGHEAGGGSKGYELQRAEDLVGERDMPGAMR